MKETLRKKLRAQRRSLSDSDHRQRSVAAAKAIMRLRMFGTGKRVAVYLPFDRETSTTALIRAARQRGEQIFVPVISDRRHCRLRFYPLKGETSLGTFGIRVPRLRARPVHLNGWTSSSYPWSASTTAVGDWGWGVDTMIEFSHSAAVDVTGRGRIWSVSPSSASAPTRSLRKRGTFD